VAGDLVAWRVIERGWRVVDAEGNVVGYVDKITGDVEEDIFDGIAFGDGGTVLTRARYVPAEQVGVIREGEIALLLGADEVATLGPYTESVSEPLVSLLSEEDVTPQRDRRP
jgi:hypothetical protein